ncbi:uncharacterized protein [Rutidosis leptorrhynchoides]|uniref:uncharacterized protein n=1 Tax=Rutidosis leptorrhynchoides TaxID=125765 RepID=UPI003A99CF03
MIEGMQIMMGELLFHSWRLISRVFLANIRDTIWATLEPVRFTSSCRTSSWEIHALRKDKGCERSFYHLRRLEMVQGTSVAVLTL